MACALQSRAASRRIPLASLAAFAFAALALVAAARAQTPAEPSPTPAKSKRTLAIEVDGGLGCGEYQSEIKAGYWYPLWIVLKANEPGATGMMTITQEGNPLNVQIPFDVAKGSSKRFRSYFKPFARDITAPKLNVRIETERLGQDDFVLPLRFADADEDHHILVLCDDPGSFSFLTRRLSDAERFSNSPNETAGRGERRPHYVSPELLPDEPLALEPFDALVISTDRAKRVSPEAWSAIERWVWLGGRVLLAGGKHYPFLLGSPLESPFGLKLSEPEPADFERALGRDDVTTQTQLLAAWPTNPPEFWTSVRAGTRERPIVAERRLGEGRFIYSSVALDEPAIEELSANRDGDDLWAALLERTAGPPASIAQASAQALNYGASLQHSFGVSLANTSLISIYILAYILLAVPINWWVCARLKRREMAWGVAIVLALVFSMFGYRAGALAQGRAAQAAQLAFVAHPAGSPVSRVAVYESVFSPFRVSADLKAERIAFPSAYGTETFDQFGRLQADLYAHTPSPVRFGASTELKRFFLHPMSARNLQTEFTLPASGGIELLPPTSPGMAITIKNTTHWGFTRWAIRDANRFWSDGGRPLLSGQTLELPEIAPVATDDVKRGWDKYDSTLEHSALPKAPGRRTRQLARGFSGIAGLARGPQSFSRGSSLRQGILSRQQSPPGVQFRGVAEGELSPFLGSLGAAARRRSIVYDESFDLAEVRKVLGGAGPFADRWMLAPVAPDGNSGDFAATRDGGWNLAFNAWTVSLVPSFPFEPPRGEALDVSLKISLVADSASMFKMAKALGRDYVARGCPLRVLNFRTNEWEDRGVWLGETLRLSPAEDYLHPSNSAVYLQLDLTKSNLYFLPAGETALDIADRARRAVPASELFGASRARSGPEVYHNYFQGGWKLYSVRISDVSVKRVAPDSAPAAEGAAP